MVTVTERAKNQIMVLMEKEGIIPETHSLRVGVTGGGCSGLSYQMKFDDKIESTDTVIDLESVKICINKLSLLYLVGTELDYEDGLNGKGFEWRNPNATRTCGCGESFSI
jgi:iron-sulfur cluster assembly protein|tara:strand:- start:279 stop:608 length:330 start_codon:yes stop_codon:yes gene_type:complete